MLMISSKRPPALARIDEAKAACRNSSALNATESTPASVTEELTRTSVWARDGAGVGP